LTYSKSRPALQPVRFVFLRCNGPLLTVITELVSWISLPDTIGYCVDVLHCPTFWV